MPSMPKERLQQLSQQLQVPIEDIPKIRQIAPDSIGQYVLLATSVFSKPQANHHLGE